MAIYATVAMKRGLNDLQNGPFWGCLTWIWDLFGTIYAAIAMKWVSKWVIWTPEMGPNQYNHPLDPLEMGPNQ